MSNLAHPVVEERNIGNPTVTMPQPESESPGLTPPPVVPIQTVTHTPAKPEETIIEQSKQMLTMVDVINTYGRENATLKELADSCKGSSDKLIKAHKIQLLLIIILAILIIYAVYRKCTN